MGKGNEVRLIFSQKNRQSKNKDHSKYIHVRSTPQLILCSNKLLRKILCWYEIVNFIKRQRVFKYN
jgi:hypothetical protein